MKKFLKILCVMVLFIGSAAIILAILPRTKVMEGQNPFRKEANNNIPFISAHQGNELLYPSNTIIAFQETLEKYDFVTDFEIDLRITKDGYVLVSHDESLKGRTNIEQFVSSKEEANVRDFTYDFLMDNVNFAAKFKNFENKSFDYEKYQTKYPTWIVQDLVDPSGYRMKACTLEQFFDEFAKVEKLKFSMDIKDRGEYVDKVAKEVNRVLNLEKYQAYKLKERVIVASFSDDVYEYVLHNYPDLIQSPARKMVTSYVLQSMTLTDVFFTNKNIMGFQIPTHEKVQFLTIRLDYAYFIKTLHRHNMAVQYWTIDEKEEMKRLIKLGADCIITNRSDIAKEVLTELGYIK